MVYQLKRLQTNKRPQAFWGSLIPSAISFIGGLITSSQQAKAQRRALEEQQRLAQQQLNISNQNQLASSLNNYASAQQSYDNKDYNLKYRIGGIKRLGSRNIIITDGGNAKRIGNNTYLLRGGSHEDINETGQTGIGINVGGNEIEAEGGEVAQRKGNSLRIYSAQPILGGMSPAQAIMRGYNKDKVFNAQQRFKKNNGIKDDGSKAAFGNLITMPFAGIVKDVVDYFSNSSKYAPKRVKVSNKTVTKKPIRNGQVGNFKVVNGKYFPNEKPLRQVYPEFDIISMGRGLPIKRSLKNTIGFVQKPNTFTRGIGNREGIKDLVESKVVRGNPVGTEMSAKAYTKATKSNRNSFNDIMNDTGREGVSHRYYNRSLSKEDFDAIRESYNKINASFKARHPKASGKIRFSIGDDVYNPLGNYKNYDDYLAQIASDRKTLRNATTINPDNGEPIAYFYNDGRNPLTQGHGYASSKWGVRISNPQDYNMKIFNGHLHYSNSKTIPFDSPNVEVFRSTPFGTIRYPKWMLRRGWYRNGGLTSKDRGSSKHPYPSVSSKDFAGGGRSYPIPTKADAIDALRLAGLHGRSDVRSKVYSRYPELRKKAEIGTNILLDPSYRNEDFLHRITQGHPTARKIINEIFGDEAERRRTMQDLNIFGLTSDDASSIAGASPIFRQPIVSAARQAQFIQDANKARQAANANKARQAANYAQQQVDYIKELSDRMSATIRNVGEQLGIRVNPNPNNSVRRLYSSNFKPANTNNRITTPRETPMNPSNSSMETPINSTTASATNKSTYSGKTTKFNTKYRSYRNAGFSPRTSKNLVKANKLGLYSTIGGFGTIGAGTLIGANINKTDKTNKTNKAQLDTKGKPISLYIARPQEPVKTQDKKSVSARKDTIATKPATRQVPATIVRKDTTRTDTTRKDTTRTNTTKQVNKVVKRQVRTTPQYTGNTTKGNYQLHDGETKVINGVKYTRRGNTIINHKTNVGYIYDKNGNYTGQADYSKVGNFNQAFDAARAAGRNQFIYRAGKYNNYSTVKETNAKKEALNRRIGARRIAKRMGCLTNPPVGSRKKYLPGGTANPWDKYRFTDYSTPNTWNEKYGISNVPDYGGVSPWQISNKYDVTVPNAISKYDLPITTITAKKNTFNDEMSRRMRAGVQNLKDDSNSKTEIPYLGKQSSFKPTTQDYIGLGIDTLAALGSGMFTRSAYNKMNFDYVLPNYVDESTVAFDTTYHNEAQRANVERNRLNNRGLITGNTSSAQTALNLMQKTDTDAMMETNKLLDEKNNKEVELRNQNAANEQQVRARNAAARNQYYQNVAQIKNAAIEAKNNIELAKAQSIGADLSGLSQAWTNFASSIENRYDNRQKEAIIAATAKDPAVLSNAVQFGYNFSPEVLAAIYNSTDDDNLKNLALSQLSTKNRLRYGIR